MRTNAPAERPLAAFSTCRRNLPRRRGGRLVCAVLAALVTVVPGTPVATANAAESADCGAQIYKSDGTAWRCTFADDFAGTRLDGTLWSPLTAKATNLGAPACLVDDPDNVSVHDGSLHLTIRKEPAPFLCEMIVGGFATLYTAGGVTTWEKFSQTYGRFETRAAFPATKEPGAYGAIWMWSQSNKGKYGDNSGEIDIAEFWTAEPDVVKPFVHYNDDGTDTNMAGSCRINRPEDFHDYVLEWTPQTLTFSYDGKVCMVNDWRPAAPLAKPAPFDEPFFMIMNTAFGGWLPDDLNAPLPQSMTVDHVKVWS